MKKKITPLLVGMLLAAGIMTAHSGLVCAEDFAVPADSVMTEETEQMESVQEFVQEITMEESLGLEQEISAENAEILIDESENEQISLVAELAEEEFMSELEVAAVSGKLTEFHAVSNFVKKGICLDWQGTLEPAEIYVLERKGPEDTGYVRLFETEELQYTDENVSDGQKYDYRLCIKKIGDSLSEYMTESITYRESLEVTSSIVQDGISIKWEGMPDIQSIKISRQDQITEVEDGIESTYWENVKNVELDKDAVSYLDTDVRSGVLSTYYFEISGTDGECYITELEYMYLAPGVPTAKIVDDGISVKWEAIAGADSYVVYRINAEDLYIPVKTVGSEDLSYLDTDVIPGTSYSYKVQAEHDSYTGSSMIKNITYMPKVEVEAANGKNGVNLSWNSFDGLDSYRIYRKTGDAGYKTLALIPASESSYTDTSAKDGVTYTYAVKAVKDNIYSTYKTAKITYLAPNTVVVKNVSNCVSVEWNKIDTAKKYYLYRKDTNSAYVRIASITNGATSYRDKNVKSGATYTYAVRAYDGKRFNAYTGVQKLYLEMPKVTVSIATGGVKVLWPQSEGAAKYYVYRKTGTGSYQRIATLSSGKNSYTDTRIQAGNTYTYAVKAGRNGTYSAYKGVSVKY